MNDVECQFCGSARKTPDYQNDYSQTGIIYGSGGVLLANHTVFLCGTTEFWSGYSVRTEKCKEIELQKLRDFLI